MPMRPQALALLGIACSAAAGSACKGDPPAAGERRPAPGDGAARPAVPDRIEGTLTLDGKPLSIVKCRPGHDETVYVDLVTGAGALRFVSGESERMFWNPKPEEDRRGAAIDCSIPHRSWGGARRPEDGTAYFRGEIAFSCRGAAGVFEGKVSLECGNISPFERAMLDDGRRRRREAEREAERAGRGGGGSGSGDSGSGGGGGGSGSGGGDSGDPRTR